MTSSARSRVVCFLMASFSSVMVTLPYVFSSFASFLMVKFFAMERAVAIFWASAFLASRAALSRSCWAFSFLRDGKSSVTKS